MRSHRPFNQYPTLLDPPILSCLAHPSQTTGRSHPSNWYLQEADPGAASSSSKCKWAVELAELLGECTKMTGVINSYQVCGGASGYGCNLQRATMTSEFERVAMVSVSAQHGEWHLNTSSSSSSSSGSV
eukprot:8207959-Pyramimonas_sp.AAC.1